MPTRLLQMSRKRRLRVAGWLMNALDFPLSRVRERGTAGQPTFFSQRSSFDQSSWWERTTSEL
jgi:hypothetical protein